MNEALLQLGSRYAMAMVDVDHFKRFNLGKFHPPSKEGKEMSLKKVELYRGFNIYAEEVRVGVWGISVIEIPSLEARDPIRPPSQGRVPGEYQSKEAALAAARAHIDRINTNRKNRANQEER